MSSTPIPRENKHPRFYYLPEIDGFAKTERERKILTMFRNFSLTGSPFILPPAMPKDRVEIIKEALRKSFKDARFFQGIPQSNRRRSDSTYAGSK